MRNNVLESIRSRNNNNDSKLSGATSTNQPNQARYQSPTPVGGNGLPGHLKQQYTNDDIESQESKEEQYLGVSPLMDKTTIQQFDLKRLHTHFLDREDRAAQVNSYFETTRKRDINKRDF